MKRFLSFTLMIFINACGPVHNTGLGAAATKTPTELKPEWKAVAALILLPKCSGCHNPDGSAKFLDLSTRQAIFKDRNRVFASGRKLADLENPENSYLLEVINDPLEPMPPKSSKIPRLNQDEVQVIGEWIQLGLP